MDPEAGDRTIEITAKNNENGYDVTRSFTIKLEDSSGVSSITINRTQVDYYTIGGVQMQSLHKGVNIVRSIDSDGTSHVNKVIIK